jgi:hypothetical protein
MSTYTYTIPGTTNKFPCFPGLYLMSGITTSNTHIPYPIFKTMSDFNDTTSLNDTADAVLLMPGYRFQLYPSADYGGTLIVDTSNSTNFPTIIDINNNTASSIKLYYGSPAGWTIIE